MGDSIISMTVAPNVVNILPSCQPHFNYRILEGQQPALTLTKWSS